MKSVLLVAEDELGLAALERLVGLSKSLSIFRRKNLHGFGALRAEVKKYNETAKAGLPVVLLTDLDNRTCEATLRDEWLRAGNCLGPDGAPFAHPDCLFRVARREVEAWLMADAKAFVLAFGLKVDKVPLSPECLEDPKAALLRLVQLGPRRFWAGMLPEEGSGCLIGPSYNDRLAEFVRTTWRPGEAAKRAPSLQRAINRLVELGQR